MKKFILILIVFIGITASSNAQMIMSGSDTIFNGAVVSVTQDISKAYDVVSFQAVVTKLTGTVAGTVMLEGSNDGTNYLSISDTLTLTDVTTNTKLWTVDKAPYKYYRLKGTGSGTMSAIISGYCVPK